MAPTATTDKTNRKLYECHDIEKGGNQKDSGKESIIIKKMRQQRVGGCNGKRFTWKNLELFLKNWQLDAKKNRQVPVDI